MSDQLSMTKAWADLQLHECRLARRHADCRFGQGELVTPVNVTGQSGTRTWGVDERTWKDLVARGGPAACGRGGIPQRSGAIGSPARPGLYWDTHRHGFADTSYDGHQHIRRSPRPARPRQSTTTPAVNSPPTVQVMTYSGTALSRRPGPSRSTSQARGSR